MINLVVVSQTREFNLDIPYTATPPKIIHMNGLAEVDVYHSKNVIDETFIILDL